jgi:hypothetical protein
VMWRCYFRVSGWCWIMRKAERRRSVEILTSPSLTLVDLQHTLFYVPIMPSQYISYLNMTHPMKTQYNSKQET